MTALAVAAACRNLAVPEGRRLREIRGSILFFIVIPDEFWSS